VINEGPYPATRAAKLDSEAAKATNAHEVSFDSSLRSSLRMRLQDDYLANL